MAPVKLNVVAFAGASNLPLWAGQAQGIFAEHSVDLVLELTPNSRAMARDLYDGHFDLAFTSVDNIVAYDEGQGEAKLAGPADFVALFGVDDGMLNVMAAAEFGTLADLRGRCVSVDAMTTGCAFVLREILGREGLADSVEWVAVGGGAQRLAALLDGAQAATLLNTPLVAWLDTHREEAAATLSARANMPLPVATRATAALLDPAHGLLRDLRIDKNGLRNVLRLRSAHATPRQELHDISRYLDLSIRDALN